MRRATFVIASLLTLLACAAAVAVPAAVNTDCLRGAHCGGLDCPEFKVIKELGNDVELRRYRASRWVVTDVDEWAYEKATVIGFQRLFKYIAGDNELEKRMEMTAPVVTTIRLDKDDNFKDDYTVSFFLPFEYQPNGDCNDLSILRRSTEAPLPRDDRVRIERIGKFDAYVLPFDSYAIGFRVRRLVLNFFDFLERNGCCDFDRTTFQVAVYDAPFKVLDRHNEIWVFKTSKKTCEAGPHV